MIPCDREAFDLMMQGSAVFADMEQAGIRIDTDYFLRMETEVGNKILELEEKLKQDAAWNEWTKQFGLSADLGKREQLGPIVFDYFKVPPKRFTKKGSYATDADAFEGINIPFVRTWLSVDTLKRIRAVNIRGILGETHGGFLRPSLNLHLALTFRSSCSDPNGQNIPNRDPRSARIVRTGFIPRGDDYVLIEADFSGAEVRAACPYHKDPTMIKYLHEDHDLHMDMSMECFKLERSQVSKQIRGIVKGAYVFASFYGDWYIQIAANLWNKVDLDELKLADGSLLRDHLNRLGLRELGSSDPKNPVPGSFEEYIKKVDHDFWHRRFPVYTQWKEQWWADYLKRGWLQYLTGFVYQGVQGRNQVINAPIQGTAFHFLLWVAIQLNDWLKANKMRSRLNLQIHDSMLIDAHKSEIDDVLNRIKWLVEVGLQERWRWINVPMGIESSVCRENWYKKVEHIEQNGRWIEKPKKQAA